MMLLTDLALRSSVILATGLLVNAALARQSAALRHFTLAATIVAAAAVIPLSVWVPEWTVPIASQTPTESGGPAIAAATVTVVEESSVAGASAIDPASMAAIGWATGSAITGTFLLVGIWRLWRTAGRAHAAGEAGFTRGTVRDGTRRAAPDRRMAGRGSRRHAWRDRGAARAVAPRIS